MLIFLIAVFSLILGYFIYGKVVERIWGISEKRRTPAVRYQDGVDYIEMPTYKCFLIQFLNIAGLGPVFGAVLGAVWGPVSLFWIVLGSIFAGGVQDFLSGMISVKYKGHSIIKIGSLIFGKNFERLFVIFFIGLLVIVGAVFALNPAKMLANLTHSPLFIWVVLIFLYYFLATLLPIDKIIGKFYPYFAALLIVVTLSILFVLFTKGGDLYHGLSFSNLHPKSAPIFPLMFITIACGAISGFHATQSPLVARCLNNEKNGRKVFYGAMITEGIIALIWATLGISYYNSTGGLLNAIEKLGQAGVISDISMHFLGTIGGALSILAIVVLAITSGDTAFRSARVTVGNYLNIDQASLPKRLVLAGVTLSLGVVLGMSNLTTLWMYFGWANQMLAVFVLWILSAYMKRKKKNYWIVYFPAMFMSAVCTTYILNAKIGFGLDLVLSKWIGVFVALTLGVAFLLAKFKKTKK